MDTLQNTTASLILDIILGKYSDSYSTYFQWDDIWPHNVMFHRKNNKKTRITDDHVYKIFNLDSSLMKLMAM